MLGREMDIYLYSYTTDYNTTSTSYTSYKTRIDFRKNTHHIQPRSHMKSMKTLDKHTHTTADYRPKTTP